MGSLAGWIPGVAIEIQLAARCARVGEEHSQVLFHEEIEFIAVVGRIKQIGGQCRVQYQVRGVDTYGP